MIRKAIVIIILLIAVIGIFMYYIYQEPMNITTEVNTAGKTNNMYEVKLVRRFEVPDKLKEISGIAYLSKDHFTSIQDENGIIFIYKTDNESIEKEIKFGHDGDYEDLALVGNDAYVIKSDGTLYEIKDFQSENPQVTEIKLSLGKDTDIEGLSFDKQDDRLLIAEKNKNKDWDNYKNIYAFDLKTMDLIHQPAYQIDINDPIFDGIDDNEVIQPSGIAIHPDTGDLYIIEGKDAKLLVMDKSGKLKTLYQLDKEFFPQPEGIAFSPQGNLYISNEGKGDNPGNILELEIIKQ